MTLTEVLQITVPAITAIATGGGVVAYIKYRSDRPKALAEAQNINITGELNLSEGWKKYAEKVELRLTEFEKKYDDAMGQKDQEIKMLRQRITELESELGKYRIKLTEEIEPVINGLKNNHEKS